MHTVLKKFWIVIVIISILCNFLILFTTILIQRKNRCNRTVNIGNTKRGAHIEWVERGERTRRSRRTALASAEDTSSTPRLRLSPPHPIRPRRPQPPASRAWTWAKRRLWASERIPAPHSVRRTPSPASRALLNRIPWCRFSIRFAVKWVNRRSTLCMQRCLIAVWCGPQLAVRCTPLHRITPTYFYF